MKTEPAISLNKKLIVRRKCAELTKSNEDEDVDESEDVVEIVGHLTHSQIGNQVKGNEEGLHEGLVASCKSRPTPSYETMSQVIYIVP